jgi:hypothetical protein
MRVTVIGALGAFGLLACSPVTQPDGGTLCACPPARFHAMMSGTVRTEADVPVANALLRIEATGADCDFARFGMLEPASGVRVNGSFTIPVFIYDGPKIVCVRAVAETQEGTPLRGESDPVALEFRYERDPADRVTVRVVMKPRNST